MVLYPNKLPESERVCSGICKPEQVVEKVVFPFFRWLFSHVIVVILISRVIYNH